MPRNPTEPDPIARTDEHHMPPVVCFTGWHNSGKTTLATQVVARLKARGYTVAVIKSTKEAGLEPEPQKTDTAMYRRAGADSVALLAPDQLILRTDPPQLDLPALAHRYFSNMDLVVAEGFKQAERVAKIEVRHNAEAPLLRDRVKGIVAVVTDHSLTGGLVFRLDQVTEITDFIVARFLTATIPPEGRMAVTVNGKAIPLPEPIRSQLAATLRSLVGTAAPSGDAATVDLSLRCIMPPQQTL